MAEDVLRLKVSKEIYQNTLNRLDEQLGILNENKKELEKQIYNLSQEDVFSGTDVKSTIEKANMALKAVEAGIVRVTGYRVAIQQQLDGVESAATTLQSNINSIDIPNMFE